MSESSPGNMKDLVANALDVIAERAAQLCAERHFEWPQVVQQAVHRLRFDLFCASSHSPSEAHEGKAPQLDDHVPDRYPLLVAIVGGASSGKSTVFNNLLDGHSASRITARGHTTLGPILAAHERHRSIVEQLLAQRRLLPGFRCMTVGLDENVAGKPDAVASAFHTVDALADVLLFDLPDFTSQDARSEGDVAMSLLPWFDRIVVVVDHERWFNRQSISVLRAESVRFAQQRWVLFNRTREETLRDEDRAVLDEQGRRLGAEGMTVLDFRRGRGFRLFPPGTLEDVHTFLHRPNPRRMGALLAAVAEAANRVLNQNEERTIRLDELRGSLHAVIGRSLPSTRDCMTSLMTTPERRQMELVSRVLRLWGTRQWLSAQTRRLEGALRQVPLVGAMVEKSARSEQWQQPDTADRLLIAESLFEAAARRQAHEVKRVVCAGEFWDEIHRWTGLEPTVDEFTWNPALKEEVRRASEAFDLALAQWNEKVEDECRGISPHVKGAVGLGGFALALVLIAAPGPVAVLTLVSAKAAIGSALTQLATAAGVGALLGKPMGRLIAVAQEKLLGSPEFDAVQTATSVFRSQLESVGRRLADNAIAEASALVMEPDDPLATALESVREPPETS